MGSHQLVKRSAFIGNNGSLAVTPMVGDELSISPLFDRLRHSRASETSGPIFLFKQKNNVTL